MKTRNALTWLACLFALLSLSGCGEKRQAIRPAQVIEVPVPAWKPLDKRLTDPIPAPTPPPANCDWHGQPAVCALDGLLSIFQWEGVRQKANADRATSATVTKQPGEP